MKETLRAAPVIKYSKGLPEAVEGFPIGPIGIADFADCPDTKLGAEAKAFSKSPVIVLLQRPFPEHLIRPCNT